jgi:hypothetical protein
MSVALLLLILISNFAFRESTTSQADFQIPTPPPLQLRNNVPLRLFAFPLSETSLLDWAHKHGMTCETGDWDLHQYAWRKIKRRLPRKGWHRFKVVWYDGYDGGRAIVIATNRSAAEMAQSQDIDLIQQYRNLLGVDPGWYRPFT